MTTLGFDVYGTLIDTTGVTTALEGMVGKKAVEFSNLWRLKQLEYTWRYGLMGQYRDFRICTRQAMEYSCEVLKCDLSAAQQQQLLDSYLELPVFVDVVAGLEKLAAAGVSMYAFSNGVPDDLRALLEHAGILHYMDGIVSVDDVSTFKPNPLVYNYFLEKSGASARDAWLISGNGFDVCGARAVGWNAVWMQRNRSLVFDPWEYAPTRVAHSFPEMAQLFCD